MDTQKILDAIDKECSPENMSKEEALDFMRDIIDDLKPKCESLEMEMEDGE